MRLRPGFDDASSRTQNILDRGAFVGINTTLETPRRLSFIILHPTAFSVDRVEPCLLTRAARTCPFLGLTKTKFCGVSSSKIRQRIDIPATNIGFHSTVVVVAGADVVGAETGVGVVVGVITLGGALKRTPSFPVSYTHLTLPTKRIV